MSERQGSTMDGHSQDGAVAVVVAVFIASVAVILLAFATDIGSLWQSQRALVTDTDAAALAGAIELAEDWMENGGECGDRAAAQAEAVSVLGLNNSDGEATNTDVVADADCERDATTSSGFSGWVEMSANQPSPGFFSGRDDLSAGGTTTATFQLELGETQGLAVCQNLFVGNEPSPEFVVSNGTDYLLFPYKFAEKTLDESVGSCLVEPSNSGAPFTAGGWGWLDGPCDLDENPLCDAETGTDDLKDFLGGREGETIDFPIFERAQDVGSNAKYLIVGRVKAELVGACGKGSTSGEDGGFDPTKDCTIPPDGKLQSQPGFVAVKDWEVTYFTDDTARKFRDARYSICDVDGSGDYCP